jgi:hypothetical protein
MIALNPPRRMHDFLVYAKVVAARLAEDPLFDPPPPSLAEFETDVAALEAATVAAATREVGLPAARRAREIKVMDGFKLLQGYVQSIAVSKPPAEAAAIIERAGMSVKNVAGPSKATFVVKPGRTADSAHAYARAAKTRASYEWQYAIAEEPWLSIAPTVRADAEFHELAAGTTYWFRVRTVTKAGVSDWSEVVTLVAG